MSPIGMRFTLICRLPGQISARPAISRSPDCASFTSIAQHSSSRRANNSVKPSGMCCTTTMLPGKSPGNCESTYCSAFGPPVEIPIATTFDGARFGLELGFAALTGQVPWPMRRDAIECFLGPARAEYLVTGSATGLSKDEKERRPP